MGTTLESRVSSTFYSIHRQGYFQGHMIQDCQHPGCEHMMSSLINTIGSSRKFLAQHFVIVDLATRSPYGRPLLPGLSLFVRCNRLNQLNTIAQIRVLFYRFPFAYHLAPTNSLLA
jgi:hypothetical protein